MIPGMFAAGAVRADGPAPGGDPHWSDVVLLTDMRAPDGTTFVDAKGHPLTANGTVEISGGEAVFNGLTMEAVEIKVEDGKDILYVDLKEETDADPSWIYDYFQGSTGGLVTETALTETFLQREYGGIWIDGVHFTMNGEAIEYDHVPNLRDTILR